MSNIQDLIITKVGKGAVLTASDYDITITRLAAAIGNVQGSGHNHDGVNSAGITGGGGSVAVPYVGPTAPTNPNDGMLWWNGDGIPSAIAGAAVPYVGENAPVNPSDGMLWWDNDGITGSGSHSDGSDFLLVQVFS